MSDFPYAGQFEIHRTLPEHGTDQATILEILSTMSRAENTVWESGQCSGTMYCGDHDHYDFLNKAFAQLLPRELAAARHVPERHQVRGRDHRHDPRPARRFGARRHPIPAGWSPRAGAGRSPTPCSPTARATAARRRAPTSSSPRPPTRPSTRPCHLFGIELRVAPVDPISTQVDLDWVRATHRRQYGRPRRLGGQLRLRHDRPDRRARRDRSRARDRTARRRLPRRIHPALRARARLRHRTLRLLGARASPRSRPTPTSTATR